MARFYAEIQGCRGPASRLGSANSGIAGHIRGWNIGCRVDISDEDGIDVVRVWRTSGSNARGSEQLIATFASDDASKPLPLPGGRFTNLEIESR